MSIKKQTLSNGVTLIEQYMPNTRVMGVLIVIDTGSKHETEPQHGMSHVLEHLCAAHDSKDMSRNDMLRNLARCGDDVRASVSRDTSRYGAVILPDQLPLAIGMLGSMVCRPALKQADFESEKAIIRNELLMHLDNSDEHSTIKAFQQAWRGQPFGRWEGGDPDTVMAMELADLQEFHAAKYVGRNIVVSIAGNLSGWPSIADLVDKAFGSMPAGKKSAWVDAEWTGGDFFLERDDMALANHNICWPAPGLCRGYKPQYVSKLMAEILGGGLMSRMFTEIREKYDIYAAGSWKSVFAPAGFLNMCMIFEKEKRDAVCEAALEVLNDMRYTVTKEEVEQQRSIILRNYFDYCENAWWRAHTNATMHLSNNDPIDPAQVVRILESITHEDVMRHARKVLKKRPVTSCIGPLASVMQSLEIQERLTA